MALKIPVLRVTVHCSEKEMLSERRGRAAVSIRKGKSEKQEGVRRERELTSGWTV